MSEISTTEGTPLNSLPDAIPGDQSNDQSLRAPQPAKEEPLKGKVQLAVIVAVLSFLGSLAGAFVGSRIEEAKWRREMLFATRKDVFSKRMELLEKTIRVLNRMQTLEAARASANFSSLEGEDLVRKGQSAQPALNAMADFTARANEFQSELSVVLTLDVIYFGPQTKRAVSQLEASLKRTEPWWNVPETKTQPLLNALAAELNLDITDR